MMIFIKQECKPLSDNIKNKLVIIDRKYFIPEYCKAKYQMVLACSGFGCDAKNVGNSVFVMECYRDNPDHYRQERYNLIGEPTEEMIAEWKTLYGEFNDEVLSHINNTDTE